MGTEAYEIWRRIERNTTRLEETLGEASYISERLDVLPNARLRLERALEEARSLADEIGNTADEEAEFALFCAADNENNHPENGAA
jgi:DNA-directed RNA polymerase sigma subunit (sigma70/sigma32)